MKNQRQNAFDLWNFRLNYDRTGKREKIKIKAQ